MVQMKEKKDNCWLKEGKQSTLVNLQIEPFWKNMAFHGLLKSRTTHGDV